MVEQDAKFITTNFDSGFDDEYSGSKQIDDEHKMQ